MKQDRFLKQIMAKKEVPEVPSELENKIMNEINQIAFQKSTNNRSFQLAWLFLIIGAILGIFLSTLLLSSDLIIFDIKVNQLRMPLLILLIGALLLIFDRLLRTVLKKDYI